MLNGYSKCGPPDPALFSYLSFVASQLPASRWDAQVIISHNVLIE
jgi:hypothetical protein